MRHALGLVLIASACGDSPESPSTPASDAGSDSAVSDASPPVWSDAPDCNDSLDAVYAATPSATAPRGTVLACATGDVLTVTEAQAQLSNAGAGDVEARTGARLIRLAYQTVRANGAPAVSSAVLYLPEQPSALPAPVALVGRSTSGVADHCAPSLDAWPHGALALPLATHGFVAIAPDFAGLGTAGTHSYLDNHEAALQLFDALLAARALGAAGTIGDAVAALGYSQGGGIVLSAQALELELTGRHTLRAVAALAPEWPLSSHSFGYESVLRSPDTLTGLAGLAPPTVTVLRHYGFLQNHLGLTGDEAFPVDQRASIHASIESLCTVELGGALGGLQRWQRDLVDDNFRNEMLACIDGTSGCSGLGAQFHAWLQADEVTADPSGARVLIAQGLADQVMLPAREAACAAAKLQREGVSPDLCIDLFATHSSIVGRKIGALIDWIDAVVEGKPAPTCSPLPLPACTP